MFWIAGFPVSLSSAQSTLISHSSPHSHCVPASEVCCLQKPFTLASGHCKNSLCPWKVLLACPLLSLSSGPVQSLHCGGFSSTIAGPAPTSPSFLLVCSWTMCSFWGSPCYLRALLFVPQHALHGMSSHKHVLDRSWPGIPMLSLPTSWPPIGQGRKLISFLTIDSKTSKQLPSASTTVAMVSPTF